MADLPTRADLFAIARAAVQSAGAPLVNPKVVDVAGSNLNIMANVSALTGEELSRAFQQCVRNLFAATSRGADLDRLLMERTGGQLPRKPAHAATATCFIIRPTNGFGAVTVPAGTRVKAASTGVEYQIDADVPFSNTDLGLTCTITCTQTGPDGNIAQGLISTFVDQPADNTMVFFNAEGAAGGDDVEDDIRYTARYFGFFPALRKGVLPAIQKAALDIPGISVATAIEVFNSIGTPAAAVQLIVGDIDGNASAPLIQQVIDSLLNVRAAGIPVTVTGGTIAYQAVTWSGLSYLTGFDSVNAQNQVRAVTVAVTQFLAPNETLHRSTLITAGRSVPGVVIPSNGLAVPVGDVVPATPLTLIRTRPSDVTFT